MRCPGTSHFYLLFLLLLTPDIHNRLMRKELDSKHLSADWETADGNVFSLLHIAKGAGDDLLGGVISVIIADGIVVNGGVEKLGEHPAGADRHHTDTSARTLELTVQRTAE